MTAERIPAGLTNTNYRVEVDGTPCFVRIPGAGTDLLAVDRGNELHNTVAAAEAGVAPRVTHTVPGMGRLRPRVARCTNHVQREPSRGATCRGASPRSCGSSTQGPGFATTSTCSAPPSGTWRWSMSATSPSRPATASISRRSLGSRPRWRVHPLASVPCHNDLLADNYLDDGERLWLVDWEYSGNNDPTFELGNTAQELGYDDDQIRELCAAYFGEASPALLARMRLQMIMSDVGWTLWAAIQARISTIDYDFTGWAEERWARAEAALDGRDFESWLQAVSASTDAQ